MYSTNPLDISSFEVHVKEYGGEDYNYFTSGNGILYIPTDFESVLFIPVNNTGGSGGAGVNYSNTKINFVYFDFQINGAGDPPCMTFSDLHANLTHNLDGLCKIPYISLKMPSGAINTWGLGSNYQLALDFEHGFQIPISEDFCNQSCMGSNGPTGCCFNFDFEIVLRPCDGNEINCPPLAFTKQFPVCCWCGSIGPND